MLIAYRIILGVLFFYFTFSIGMMAGAHMACTANCVQPSSENNKIIVRLGETSIIQNLAISPIELKEDSRCPVDVTCIQAGTVRVSVKVASSKEVKETLLALGESVELDTMKIKFIAVTPVPIAQNKVSSSAYEFIFEIRKQP